jgi:hypothetical protein
MKRLLALVLLMIPAAFAQTPFDGTWKLDVTRSELPKKPEQYLLQNGTYSCSTCVPNLTVKADGKDHTVQGSKYFDTLAVTQSNPNTVDFVYKRGGKTVDTEEWSVSPDGNTLTAKTTERQEGSDKPVNSQYTMSRVDKGPQGSHLISGSWRQQRIDSVSDNGAIATIKSMGDGLSLSVLSGYGWEAKFDGKDYQVKNDPGNTMVSLKKIDDHTIEERAKRDGKVVTISRWTVSPDGRTLRLTQDNRENGTTTTYVAFKQ